jgi:Cu-processing system ATP-binding protein
MEDISRQYNGIHALKGIDLDVVSGEWLGLVGPNGSGKTTIIRIILGLMKPTSGKIYLDGKIPDRENWLAFKSRVGFMPERIQFYDNLTGEETLNYLASIRGILSGVASDLLSQVGLSQAIKKKVGEYSKGMRQRLNLAQALLGDPEILILDEPTEGLDPHAVRQFFHLLKSPEDRKKTVLLASHRLGELESQVDRVCILGDGEIRALGTPRELMSGLKLSVKIHILLSESWGDRDASSLHHLGFTVSDEDGKHLTAEVNYGDKTKFLENLYGTGLKLEDIWIEEPDLEEVYFETH